MRFIRCRADTGGIFVAQWVPAGLAVLIIPAVLIVPVGLADLIGRHVHRLSERAFSGSYADGDPQANADGDPQGNADGDPQGNADGDCDCDRDRYAIFQQLPEHTGCHA
jgi:hypothetical protein